MLRVGLTGSLGSGKSTVAEILRELGADVIEADALGRELMEPGHAVFNQIVEHFGAAVLTSEGRLNRSHLAQLAFRENRVQELNAIIHPATVAAQRLWAAQLFARNPSAVAVVESALIFEVMRDARARGEKDAPLADLRRRFDRVIVITAPDDLKIARYVARICPAGTSPDSPEWKAAEADARARLAHQIPDAEKAAHADYVIENAADKTALRTRVEAVWRNLQAQSNKSPQNLSLE
jgi:dephospho-CoA kinase